MKKKLVLKGKVQGKVVFLSVTDLDGFVHAAPFDKIIVNDSNDQLFTIQKNQLSDLEVDDS